MPEDGRKTARSLPASSATGSTTAAAAPGGASTRALALQTIGYDESGRVVLSGRADAGAELRFYLANRFIGTAEAAPDGSWSSPLPGEIAPAVDSLRADDVRTDGAVLSRVAVPFERAVAATAVDTARSGDVTVVQPGSTLWRIAKRVYGRGGRYAEIYSANRAHIAAPNLIHPEQIFDLPQR